jgi:hypothetical protein
MAVSLGFVAVVLMWNWFLHKRSDFRMWSPAWLAFTLTTAAVIFMVAGATGFILDKRTRFFAGTSWSSSVIWWEVGVGVVLVPVAVWSWMLAHRDLERRLKTPS